MIQVNDKVIIHIDNVEAGVISQVIQISALPIFDHVRIMPDTHVGKGCVIGFTAPLDLNFPCVIPEIVGVDIGCGILSVNIGNNLPDSFENIDNIIQKNIPMGFDVNRITNIENKKQIRAMLEQIYETKN